MLLPTLRGPLCRLFALRLPVAGDGAEQQQEEEEEDVSIAFFASSSDSDGDSDQALHPPPTAAAAAASPAQVGRGRRQLQVPLRPEDVILHIEIRDLEQEEQVDWMRALHVARPLYSAAFAIADPRVRVGVGVPPVYEWLAVYRRGSHPPFFDAFIPPLLGVLAGHVQPGLLPAADAPWCV